MFDETQPCGQVFDFHPTERFDPRAFATTAERQQLARPANLGLEQIDTAVRFDTLEDTAELNAVVWQRRDFQSHVSPQGGRIASKRDDDRA
ncbi:MAG: hypothetical protein MI757_20150 [Pirellulales bacterium]|nr:hypothetical protein [Pirellulales bacterium]